jgi:hypothetical protein
MNMSNFCTSYCAWLAHVCKIWRFDLLWIFVSKYSKIWYLGILYKEIMYKMEFGQAYWIDLFKRIIRKLIWYFSEFCTIYYEFLKFKQISRVFNSETNFWKLIIAWTVLAAIHPMACCGRLGPMAKVARWPKPVGAWCACPTCGHRARDRRGGAAATGALAAGPGFGLHVELHRDMGDLPGTERRTGSHRRHGAAMRWR